MYRDLQFHNPFSPTVNELLVVNDVKKEKQNKEFVNQGR